MKELSVVVIVLLLAGFKTKNPPVQSEWTIPTQTFNPWLEMGLTRLDTITVNGFVVTRQVTLGEYRKYLDGVKRDCTETFYKSQLPDSSMCTRSAYANYMQPGTYDACPVSGVTWIAASNYCKWKTEQDKLPDSLEYRLPFTEDWFSAYRYLRLQNVPNDFNRNYSDWLMNAFDESAYDFYHEMAFSYSYNDRDGEPSVLRRKEFIGNSFHHQHAIYSREYGYSFKGYSFVSFRMIKVLKSRRSAMLHRNLRNTQK